MASKKPTPETPAEPDGDADFADEVLPDNTQVPVGRPAEGDGK